MVHCKYRICGKPLFIYGYKPTYFVKLQVRNLLEPSSGSPHFFVLFLAI